MRHFLTLRRVQNVRGSLRGLFLALCLSLALPLHAETARILSDALGCLPLSWIEALPCDRAATLCAQWAMAFHEANDEENTKAMLVDALAFLIRDRSPIPSVYAPWLRAFPNDPLLLNNAAWALLIAEDQPEAALALLRRIPPHQRGASDTDTLSCVLLRLGHPADALQASLVAIEAARRDEPLIHPLLFEHLGNALYANGFHREALSAWRAARRRAQELDAAYLTISDYDDARLLLRIRALRRLLGPETDEEP